MNNYLIRYGIKKPADPLKLVNTSHLYFYICKQRLQYTIEGISL